MSRQRITGRNVFRAMRTLARTIRRLPPMLVAALCLACLAGPGRLNAQRPDTTKRARPAAGALAPALVPACCKVVAIDTANRTVTARETATGYAFRFRVYDPRDFAPLDIGDPVWADFANRTVRVDAGDPEPCCTILAAPPPAGPSRKAPRPLPDDLAWHPPLLGRP